MLWLDQMLMEWQQLQDGIVVHVKQGSQTRVSKRALVSLILSVAQVNTYHVRWMQAHCR